MQCLETELDFKMINNNFYYCYYKLEIGHFFRCNEGNLLKNLKIYFKNKTMCMFKKIRITKRKKGVYIAGVKQ